MRFKIHVLTTLLLVAVVSSLPSAAHAQSDRSNGNTVAPELALNYSFLRSNAPPGGCGCFNLNGGSAAFAWPISKRGLAVVGDVTIAHAGAITSSGYSLTLSTYTAGIGYRPSLGHSATPLWQPFGRILVGLGHSSGSLVQGQSTNPSNAGAAFAASAGGGVDLRVTHRIAIRLIEADYLATTFDNGSNNHQNNLRISAGLVLRIGK